MSHSKMKEGMSGKVTGIRKDTSTPATFIASLLDNLENIDSISAVITWKDNGNTALYHTAAPAGSLAWQQAVYNKEITDIIFREEYSDE